jgi:hypothetical protein
MRDTSVARMAGLTIPSGIAPSRLGINDGVDISHDDDGA